jgi:hypothetical protein
LHAAAEDVPVEVEDRLPTTLADVDDDAVVLQTNLARRVGNELQHPLGLVRRKLRDLAKARDVALGNDEQMRLGTWVDVADRDEPVGLRDVLALTEQLAEEALLRQRESPPPTPPLRTR